MSRVFAVVALCALSLSLVFGSGSALAKPADGSNSGNAKSCQKGGYTTLARNTDPDTAFASEQECTAYAAEGGTVVPYAGITVMVKLSAFKRTSCPVVVTVTGLQDTQQLFVTLRGGGLTLTFWAVGGYVTFNASLERDRVVESIDLLLIGEPVSPISTSFPSLPFVCTA